MKTTETAEISSGILEAILWTIKRRYWWWLVDELLHILDGFDFLDPLWRINNWRVKFCTWCTMRYLRYDEAWSYIRSEND